MDKKIEEMIALGASYALNCQFCIEYHKKKAIEVGLTNDEMLFAIQIADNVKTGASNKTKQFVKKNFGEVKEEPCCPAGSECCP